MDELTEPELMTRAAWLYYEAGLNQQEAPLRLGVTRARVNRLLRQARETGVVSIAVNERDLGLLKVEEALCKRYGLESCIATVPLGAQALERDQNAALRLVGAAAARLLLGCARLALARCIGALCHVLVLRLWLRLWKH